MKFYPTSLPPVSMSYVILQNNVCNPFPFNAFSTKKRASPPAIRGGRRRAYSMCISD